VGERAAPGLGEGGGGLVPGLPGQVGAAPDGEGVGVALGYWEPGIDPAPLVRTLLEETKDNRSSMAEDLARGRRTEIEEIVGSILRFAAEQSRPVPVLEALHALVLAAGNAPVDTVG